jgi:tRNA (guanine37-N1)-methyltransferase
VDDTPYGGGAGMVMKPGPFFEAVTDIAGGELDQLKQEASIILLTPQGVPLDQKRVKKLAQRSHLILLCGRYEGVDERVREFLVTEEISIGDYILSGGEIPALILIEAIARFVPGVLGAEHSREEESFIGTLLEYPQYTRPAEYQGLKVPEILLSGNHAKIEEWRKRESIKKTLLKRPDIIREDELSPEYKELYRRIKKSGN